LNNNIIKTQQEIINSNWTKTKKAEALFDLGFTRLQVATLICNGTRGFSYNIWKKWNERRTANPQRTAPVNFEFSFTRKFGVEIELRAQVLCCHHFFQSLSV
jgi:hypothetical protein